LGAKFKGKIASGWGELLSPLMYMGRICFGPTTGPNVTFVRVDRWIGKLRSVDPDEAWRELVLRFLRAYGPTTLEGIARWFGTKPAAFRTLLRSFEPDVAEVIIEGRKAWMLSRDRAAPRPRGPAVRLLPQYDCYVIGSHPRDTIIDAAAQSRIRTHKRGQWEGAAGVPVLLVDGIVSGVWDRSWRGDGIDITVHPATKLTRAQSRGVEKEVTRIGRFFGREATLT
jgi:hypothetical protein